MIGVWTLVVETLMGGCTIYMLVNIANWVFRFGRFFAKTSILLTSFKDFSEKFQQKLQESSRPLSVYFYVESVSRMMNTREVCAISGRKFPLVRLDQ